MSILKQRQAEAKTDYVFPGKTSKKGYMAHSFPVWKKLLATAGLSNLRIHDLRRTLASHAAIGGTPLLAIGRMLGQSSLKSTMVYARLSDESVKAAFNSAGSAVSRPVKNERPEG
jgi:integrase